MGKSAAANFFSQKGIPLLDSDDLAREVVAPGQEGWIRLVDCYGDNILLPDRTLDRKKVAEIVFKEEKERRFLESVLHPLIRQRWQKWALELEAKGESLCMVVVPLLFESHLEADFDGVICLVTDPEIQLRRLQDRGMDLEDIQARCPTMVLWRNYLLRFGFWQQICANLRKLWKIESDSKELPKR